MSETRSKKSPHLITVVGNRPQFVKMAPISQELKRRGYSEFILHTGQHKDDNLSQVFFDELGIPQPDLNLSISGGTHGAMTAQMLEAIEKIFLDLQPPCLMIYGDTNSTMAAALAAAKLCIPISHVESGPRIFDMENPEEINRVFADHVSKLRFCPDVLSVQNLARENLVEGTHFTGDVMYDAFLKFSETARQKSTVLDTLGLNGKPFVLLTTHRPINTDTLDALNRICVMLKESPMPVVFPVHPRTEGALKRFDLWDSLKRYDHIKLIPPVGYLDVLQLINQSELIMTDSGGLQKEGFFAGKPVIVLYTTPWPQIEASGWQKSCWDGEGINVAQAIEDMGSFRPTTPRPNLFGDGHAASHIVDILERQPWWSKVPVQAQ